MTGIQRPKINKLWPMVAFGLALTGTILAKGDWEEQQVGAEKISAEYQAQYPNVTSERFVFKTITLPDGKSLDLDMRIVRPKTGGPFPVVFYVHGGAWATGSKAQFTHESYVLADHGIAGVRMEYRWKSQGGVFTNVIGDVLDAIDFVRQRKDKLNLDFTRVGLAGGSAGGHLSAIAAQLTPECICYDGFNGLYDALDRNEGRFGGGDYTGTTDEEKKRASAIYLIKTPPPDTFLYHGTADTTIDIKQSYRFAEAIRNKGGKAEVLAYEGVGHGFFNKDPYETATTGALLAHTSFVFGLTDKKPVPSAYLVPAKEDNPAVVAVPRETEGKQWLVDRLDAVAQELETRDLSKVRVLFVGDSITQHWLTEGATQWNTFANALNLGVAGDRTEHVLYRLKSKADGGMGNLDDPKLKPKTIMLMIGTNNLFTQQPDQIIAGIVAVRDRLLELEPQARIILCSVLPTSDAARNHDIVVPVNQAIQSLKNVQWLDLYSAFVDADGLQSTEYFKDGVHLNEAGYQVWHDRLVPIMGR